MFSFLDFDLLRFELSFGRGRQKNRHRDAFAFLRLPRPKSGFYNYAEYIKKEKITYAVKNLSALKPETRLRKKNVQRQI